MSLAIPCPFPVGWVKRQRNPTHLLGFMLQPNLQIKAFSNLDKVLRISEYRVTYQVDDTTNQVIVTTIAHRSKVYE